MCKLCERGWLQPHATSSRRQFFKTSGGAGLAAAAGIALFNQPARAHGDDDGPEHSGRHGRRYVIRGGAVMSMDPRVGNFEHGDVLVEGKKIIAVGRHIHAPGAAVIDARGRIVTPGFIDTHHHQFETALRRVLKEETDTLATKADMESLRSSVDGLAKTVASYLKEEWTVHVHDVHPALLARIERIEEKLGLNVE